MMCFRRRLEHFTFPRSVIADRTGLFFCGVFSGAESGFTCQLFLLLQLLFELLQFGHGVEGRNGHSWNLGQTAGWSSGDRRVPAVQEELSVVNNPGSWRKDRTLITAANHMARKMHVYINHYRFI